MDSRKPNAPQFFDIWCEAVPLVRRSLANPSDAIFWSQSLWGIVAVRHGSRVAEWAVAYLDQLKLDIVGRGTI